MRYFPPEIIFAAKRNSPLEILRNHGYIVQRDGKSHYKIVKDGVTLVRLTQRADSCWLWAGQNIFSAGGDNISLIMELLHVSFPDAVNILTRSEHKYTSPSRSKNSTLSTAVRHIILPQPDFQTLPLIYQYLSSIRGITISTINFAKAVGFIQFISTGVVFCGYDHQHRLRNADFRAAFDYVQPQKRCFYGSDKHYPPILPGTAQRKVWIVEGGMDALALRDCALRQQVSPPVIIVSGGANVCICFDNPNVQAILQQAIKVTVAFDHETSQGVQKVTNAAHAKQLECISSIVRTECLIDTFMPAQDKDLASMNLRILRNTTSSKLI